MLNILTLTKALQQLRTDASIDFTNNIPLKHARNRVLKLTPERDELPPEEHFSELLGHMVWMYTIDLVRT
jgi:uncharacterized membrane protein YagU involved in acid resistance